MKIQECIIYIMIYLFLTLNDELKGNRCAIKRKNH